MKIEAILVNRVINHIITTGVKGIKRIKIQNEDGGDPEIDDWKIYVDTMIYPYYDLELGSDFDNRKIIIQGDNKLCQRLVLELYYEDEEKEDGIDICC